MSKITEDLRIDPSIRKFFGSVPDPVNQGDVENREQLLEEANSPAAVAFRKQMESQSENVYKDDMEVPDGLTRTTFEFKSTPDGNVVKVLFMRPNSDHAVPCIVYLHGGGMSSGSCFDAPFRTWGRRLVKNGVAVAMVDFRNCLIPSSSDDVAPFPAGLNDCVSGVKWVVESRDTLGIDSSNVIVSGESGGGNLTLATGLKMAREGTIDLVQGLYAFCPYIAGRWPQERFPSSSECNGYLLELANNRGAMGYGIQELENENPLAWPSFATEDDVKSFPPTVISVNEFDPLRDEGIDFYRLLLRAGVSAYCRDVRGTIHATELIVPDCVMVAEEGARSVSNFCNGSTRP